ncbi:isopentenyl-diphosphate Delta-isomerase, partial [Paragonimus westermani]
VHPMRVCIPRSLPLLLDHAKSRFCSCATGVTEQSVRIQEEFMLNDLCLRVNEYDEVLGYSSKKECHRILHNTTPLHRAFSLFLFRHSPLPESGLQLLVQRRSPSKFTFPTLWSNTCCSHPIANIPHETVEENALGVKWAAARKVEHELGIRAYTYMPVSSVHFLTRIVYFALNEPPGSDQWAEHELDYILVSVLSKSIDFIEGPCIVNQNPEEQSSVLGNICMTLEQVPLSNTNSNLTTNPLVSSSATPQSSSEPALANLWTQLDRIQPTVCLAKL